MPQPTSGELPQTKPLSRTKSNSDQRVFSYTGRQTQQEGLRMLLRREAVLIVSPLKLVPGIPGAARPGRARDAAPVSICAAILHVERVTDSL